ncbi:MAG: hypothetical protein ACYTF6_02535 [Planctomycetota bacterium]|jgi:hypothetical protein
MHQAIRFGAVLVVSMAFCAAGCNGKAGRGGRETQAKEQAAPEKKLPKAARPEQGLMNFAKAVAEMDKQGVLSAVITDDPEFTARQIDGVFAGKRFRGRFVEVYGKDKVHLLGFPEPPGFPEPEEVGKEWKVRSIDENNAIAEMHLGDVSASVKLAKREGQWKLDMRTETPPSKDRAAALKHLNGLLAVLDECERLIGKEGLTPEELAAKVKEKILAVYTSP